MQTEHACRVAHRYTIGGRHEHTPQVRMPEGPHLSRAVGLSHIHASSPIHIHTVSFNAPYVTEANARHPNAVDRHIRVVQWQHWCRDKCRPGCTSLHANSCPLSITTTSILLSLFLIFLSVSLFSYPPAHGSHSSSPLHPPPFSDLFCIFGSRMHRWQELTAAIRFCNSKSQFLL